jgi:hypothetical protein
MKLPILFGYAKHRKPSLVDKPAKTTIKLNGQSYDALSGQPIGGPRAASIDGIVKPSAKSVQKSYSKPRTPKPVVKKPLPSQTLMREAVRKPAKTRQVSKTVSPLSLTANTIQTPVMYGSIDPKLARRAKSFKLSPKVSRFGATVRQADPSSPYLKPTPTAAEAIQAKKARPTDTMLERAVAKATSHEQPKLTKKDLKALHGKRPLKGRIVGYSAIGLTALVVLGYAVYQNIPNIMVKVASVRAGFAASLPAYRPSGFTLANVGYQPGTVSFDFKSNIDSRKFAITEHSSNWDSATLVSSVVIPTEGHNYKKIQIDGQELYLFGNDQAAWVSNGIWYQIRGNDSLSTNQIIQFATTL